ncbi:Hexose carrier protein [Mycena indigotica]|uniref:Hexose carrier protein n=1 Tax=Mycena indigotica TaxID=2126181 RepID=A0A8H6S1W1_9AGAR|nr:Hexose carrier protein [Mycena indigotica]KAF7290700.1 Hexose carrier protein [Mycena indigotica]
MASYGYTRVHDEDGDGAPEIPRMRPYFGITGDRLSGWVTVACTTAMILFGYDQGVFGGIIITPDFLETMGNPNPSLQGAIVALYDIGCLFGALAAMVIGERLGRKKTFLVGVVVMSLGALMQTSAYTVGQMIVARIITGLGNGQNQYCNGASLAERNMQAVMAREARCLRDDVCSSSINLHSNSYLLRSMNIAGFALSNWMTYGFSFTEGSASWRFPIAFQLFFSVVLFATIPWLPESPRWLLMHGFETEGVAVLAALHGEDATPEDEAVIDQKMEILEAVRMENDASPSWSDILHLRTGETGMVQRLLLGAGAQLMQQGVGINVTSYYLPLVLQNSVGLSNNLSRLLAACNSISYLLFAFFGLVLIERAGRRKMMIWGAMGQAVCYAFISYCLAHAEDKRYGIASTFFFFSYYLFFGICWQGVPWLYPVEINSLAMRTKGAALATAANWLSNYVVVEITPPGIASMGWRFYLIWMFFNVLFVPVVWLFYPETANRHLEDIDYLYRENPRMVVVVRNKEAIQLERPQRFIEAELRRAARDGHVVVQGVTDVELRKRT